MSFTNDQLIDAIGSLTVLQLTDLIKQMEEKFNVSAAAVMAAAPAAGATTSAAVEEKTEFSVTLDSFGDKKVEVIKVVRAITGLGLKEAKDLVEGAPAAVKSGVSKADAEKMKKDLEEVGAKVSLK